VSSPAKPGITAGQAGLIMGAGLQSARFGMVGGVYRPGVEAVDGAAEAELQALKRIIGSRKNHKITGFILFFPGKGEWKSETKIHPCQWVTLV
jgi:hypothetical protein